MGKAEIIPGIICTGDVEGVCSLPNFLDREMLDTNTNFGAGFGVVLEQVFEECGVGRIDNLAPFVFVSNASDSLRESVLGAEFFAIHSIAALFACHAALFVGVDSALPT